MNFIEKMIKELTEDIAAKLKNDNMVFKNPTKKDLNELYLKSGKNVRFIANERTKNFYVFTSELLHFQACRDIPEFEPILQYIATPEQPSFLFTGTGIIEMAKITITQSDIIQNKLFSPQIRKEIKMRDWSFANQWLNTSIKDFMRHIKLIDRAN